MRKILNRKKEPQTETVHQNHIASLLLFGHILPLQMQRL